MWHDFNIALTKILLNRICQHANAQCRDVICNPLPVHDAFSICVVTKFSKLKHNIHFSQAFLEAQTADSLLKENNYHDLTSKFGLSDFFRRRRISIFSYTCCGLGKGWASKWRTQVSSIVTTIFRKFGLFWNICYHSQY